jgi:hypothetical protein
MSAVRYNTDGTTYPAAASVSRGEGADDPQGMSRRIVELERSKGPSWAEYDVAYTTAGATIVLNHNLGPQVRWFVTQWRPSGASALTDGFYRVFEISQEQGILTLGTNAGQVTGGIVTFRLEQIQ